MISDRHYAILCGRSNLIRGNMSKLTPKQEKFCQEYLIDLNATQAAVRAGYSAKTAEKIAHENQRKPEIQARIEELRQSQQERTQVDADRVVEKLWKIATFDIRSVCTFDRSRGWEFKPTSKWDECEGNRVDVPELVES